MKKILLYMLLLPWIGVACMEDKGSYEYMEVNEITIDTLCNQTIEIYDTLKVEPKVSCSLSTPRFEYCWYRYTDRELEVDTLSIMENLSYKVSLRVGDYTIYLKVTDATTGLSAKSTFKLSVVGKFSTGLMVLGEEDGGTDLVFINSAGNVTQLYGPGNDSELGRNPILIADASAPQIATVRDMLVLNNDGKGGIVLRNEDFSKSSDLSELFFVAPATFNSQAYYKGMNTPTVAMADFIINDGKLHARALGYTAAFGNPVGFNPVVSGDYDLSSWAIVNGKNFLFYDNKNERFLALKGSILSVQKSFTSLTSATAGFDPAHVGMQLIYMAEGKAMGAINRGFGIFKNKQNQLIRLIFSLDNFNVETSNNMSLLARNEVTPEADGIDQATSYAMSIYKPYLFFSKGSKIYQYELENNLCFPIYDADTVISNSTVDKIYIEYVPNTSGYGNPTIENNSVLYVSSSQNGTSGKNGTIHILKLAENGKVEERMALYPNICGKTVSMCYRR